MSPSTVSQSNLAPATPPEASQLPAGTAAATTTDDSQQGILSAFGSILALSLSALFGVDPAPNTDRDENAATAPAPSPVIDKRALDDALQASAKVMGWAAPIMNTLSLIPVFGEAASVASSVLEREALAANILHVAITGGNVDHALDEAAHHFDASVTNTISSEGATAGTRAAAPDNGSDGDADAASEGASEVSLSVVEAYTLAYLAQLAAQLESQQRDIPDPASQIRGGLFVPILIDPYADNSYDKDYQMDTRQSVRKFHKSHRDLSDRSHPNDTTEAIEKERVRPRRTGEA